MIVVGSQDELFSLVAFMLAAALSAAAWELWRWRALPVGVALLAAAAAYALLITGNWP